MKNTTGIQKFKENEAYFICPICHEKMYVKKYQFFKCRKGHCFDIASKGYVNFMAQNKKMSYEKPLFECRQRILEAGFYSKVLQEIDHIIQEYRGDKTLHIVDIGCGEGYYATCLKEAHPSFEIWGMDIVKDAIKMAATKQHFVNWMVGNLANIPLQKQSMDVILNILTPANYKEFFRVLKQEGIVIKVIPGKDYLKEIRTIIAKEKKHIDVEHYFEEHIQQVETREIYEVFSITQEQANDFFDMTPMTWHVDKSNISLARMQEITIHLQILIGRKEREV